jgi:L-lactate dehydrogenase (cytochrome)
MKAIYAGADLVFVGRPFLYGVGAFQEKGAQQAYDILEDQLRNNMMQMGIQSIKEIRRIDTSNVMLKL